MTDRLAPGLHVVATPIGNLGDLSPRAADTLRRADRILAEDTRVTAKLLAHIGAKAPMNRADAIAEVAAMRATLVLYESGPRLAETLAALAEVLGTREAAVAREITKLDEDCVTGLLEQLAERYGDAPPKGEIVIVVGPPAE